MARAILFYYFLGIIACQVRCNQEILRTEFEDFKAKVFRELKSRDNYLGYVDSSLRDLRKNNRDQSPARIAVQTTNTSQQSLDVVLETVRNLSTKVEALGRDIIHFKNDRSGKVEALNNSLEMVHKQLLNINSLAQTQQGIILGTGDGLLTISFPSLHQSKISNGEICKVAFDWISGKVYWGLRPHYEDNVFCPLENSIARANLDGTEMENVTRVHKWSALAVDSTTGNIFYNNMSLGIRVCSTTFNKKCAILATTHHVYGIVVHPSKSLIFWADSNSVVRANMDGTNATVILHADAYGIIVEETEDRLYWIDENQKSISSCDLNGQNHRLVFRSTVDYDDISAFAILRDTLFFSLLYKQSLYSVRKDGGDPAVIARTTGRIRKMVIYGSAAPVRVNPCATARIYV